MQHVGLDVNFFIQKWLLVKQLEVVSLHEKYLASPYYIKTRVQDTDELLPVYHVCKHSIIFNAWFLYNSKCNKFLCIDLSSKLFYFYCSFRWLMNIRRTHVRKLPQWTERWVEIAQICPCPQKPLNIFWGISTHISLIHSTVKIFNTRHLNIPELRFPLKY